MKVHFDEEELYDDRPDIRFIPPSGEDEWPIVSEWGYRHWFQWLAEHDRQFNSGWTRHRIDQYIQKDRYEYGLGFRRTEKEAYTW